MRRALPALAADTMWYGAAGFVGKTLALLSVPFLTRALGPDDYGLVDLATATAGLLTVIAMFAGDIPAARLAAFAGTVQNRRRKYTAYIVAVVMLSALISGIVVLSADFIADAAWSSPDASDLVVLAAMLIPIAAVRAALANLHRLEGNPRRFAMLTTVDVVAQLVLAVAMVWIGLGPRGAVWGLVLGGALALVVAIAVSRPLLSRAIEPRAVGELISKGAPLLPPLVAFGGADYAARAIVADALGQAAVGEMAVAIRVASVLTLLTAAFQLAWSPRAAAMRFDLATRRRLGRTLVAYVVCSGLLCIAIVSAAPELVEFLSGASFAGAATILPALAFAAVLAGTHFVLLMGSVIGGGTWMVPTSSMAGAIIQVLVTVVLIRDFGLWAVGAGAVIGRAASVGMLAGRVASAFADSLVPAFATLLVVAVTCVFIGLVSVQTSGSLPVRAAFAICAGIGLYAFLVKAPSWAAPDPA